MVMNTRPPPPFSTNGERDHYLETKIRAMQPGDYMKVDRWTIGSEEVIRSLKHDTNYKVEWKHHDNTVIIKRVAAIRDYETMLMDSFRQFPAIKIPSPPCVPDEYKELADPNSEMFDPLTCIKNGVKVKR